jgi:hypothetical protein
MPYHLSRIRSDMDTRGDLDRYLKRDHQRVSNDAEWDFLNEYEYVRDVEIEASEISELAEKTVELRQTFGPATSSRLDRRVAVVAEKALAPSLGWRGKALSAIFAVIASSDRRVLAFRSKELSGGLVAPQDVEGWLRSRAAVEEAALQDAEFVSAPIALGYRLPGETDVRVVFVPRTRVFVGLVTSAESLAEDYAWNVPDVVTYLLTGEPPPVVPIVVVSPLKLKRGDNAAATRVTVDIDPTTTPGQLAHWWGQVRSALLDHGYRAMSEKHLALASCHDPAHVKEKSWSTRMREWNLEQPAWRYDSVWNFQRDAVRARARLLNPPLRHPRRPVDH